MDNNLNTQQNFYSFYYNLKNELTLSKNNLTHSEIISQKIDLYFNLIFGEIYKTDLQDNFDFIYAEVENIEDRINKTTFKIVKDFYYKFNSIYDEITESKFVYFFKSSYIEKKLSFKKGDKNFNCFLTPLILKNIKFENQNFTFNNEQYETIIKIFIDEIIKNIRFELKNNSSLIDSKDILYDINTLEIKKNEGRFEFLEESIKSLRQLYADIDLLNADCNHTTKVIPVQNAFENNKKKDSKLKIEINFSPTKFRNLLIMFFKNTGIEMDQDKKNRIDRFILNIIKFDTVKFKNFKHSPKTNSINFFGNKANILKFCGLIIFLTQRNYAKKISIVKLQNILRNEINTIDSKIYISEDLRIQIGNKITSKEKTIKDNEIAKFAGFANTTEIITCITN